MASVPAHIKVHGHMMPAVSSQHNSWTRWPRRRQTVPPPHDHQPKCQSSLCALRWAAVGKSVPAWPRPLHSRRQRRSVLRWFFPCG